MSDPAGEAIAAFQRWSDGFNARDVEAQVATMHFPHVRISATNELQRWESADDFRAQHDRLTERLRAEGWDHTASPSIEVVQVGDQKVHLAMHQSRQHADGTEYNGFDTLWIFTQIDGRWGVQFRSSFLANAAQGFRAGSEGKS
ncbi:MAG TPA: hypothetical protein QF624_05615 [Dehalococcoidia bacterium]|nr:hypothetical protein [Dehalococcoidia bacterium]